MILKPRVITPRGVIWHISKSNKRASYTLLLNPNFLFCLLQWLLISVIQTSLFKTGRRVILAYWLSLRNSAKEGKNH